jgi:hypothetical protein
VCENSISKLSPEGTAEPSPGRESWVRSERTTESPRDDWKSAATQS